MKTLTLTHQPPEIEPDADSERMGLPSASAMDRLAHCPGSWRMERNMPQLGRYAALADSGTRIHNWLSGATGETLNAEEMRTAQSLKAGAEKLKAEWLESVGNLSAHFDLPEERRFLHSGLRPALSGKWDVLTVAGDHFLILDYKTGWQDLPPVRSNLQLRAYALLVWAEHREAKSISVAIVRPGDEENEKSHFFTYTRADLEAAWFQLEGWLSAVFSPAHAVVAGDHCQFCKAQHTCPVRIAALNAFKVDSGAVAAWADLTPSHRADLFRVWRLAKKYGEAVEEKIREDLGNGVTIPGVHIGKGRTLRKIDDAQAAYARAIAAGMTHDQFMALVEVSFAKLRDGIQKIAGWKVKEANDKAGELFAGLVTETTTKGGLEVA